MNRPNTATPVELGAHVQKRPLTGLRPIDLIALGIELATVFGHQADTDKINGVRLLDELGVDPISHALSLPSRDKWSRVMRFATAYKLDSEALDQFIKRKGGIDACAAWFSRT